MKLKTLLTSICSVLLLASCETERVNSSTSIPGSVSFDSIKFSAVATGSRAKFFGTVEGSGNLKVTPGIIISYSGADLDIDNNDSSVAGPEGTGSFSVDINTLKPLTNIWFRTYVKNLDGIVYSPVQTGFTFPFAPAMLNGSVQATEVTNSSAKLTANLTRNGGDGTNKKGFLLALASTPPITLSNHILKVESADTTRGVFALNVSGLAPATKYFYVGFSTNRATTIYTSARNFTTLP